MDGYAGSISQNPAAAPPSGILPTENIPSNPNFGDSSPSRGARRFLSKVPLDYLSAPVLAPVSVDARSTGYEAHAFKDSFDNTVRDSEITMAQRDVTNYRIYLNLPPSTTQPAPNMQTSSDGARLRSTVSQSVLQQSLSVFTYVISRFTGGPSAHTSVTLLPQEPQNEEPSTGTGSPGSSGLNDETRQPSRAREPDAASLQNTESSDRPTTTLRESVEAMSLDVKGARVGIEASQFEIALLDELDISGKHQPAKTLRPLGFPNASNPHEVYVRNMYPNGHGYPCSNPYPLDQPVRIGDVGVLTSDGLSVLANLHDCPLPSLESHLTALGLSDERQDRSYFPEGYSITGGGVSDCEYNYLPQSRTIDEIRYLCQGSEGAILAITSPAERVKLKDHEPLRKWLETHGLDLINLVQPGRSEPLYVVTGTVTSSSWAIATYSEAMKPPNNLVVLTHLMPQDEPAGYEWTRWGKAKPRSRTSENEMNPRGERPKDQCLFLLGFLLTPSPKYKARQTRERLKAPDAHSAPGSIADSGSQHYQSTSGGSVNNGGDLARAKASSFSSGTDFMELQDAALEAEIPLIVEEVPSQRSTAGTTAVKYQRCTLTYIKQSSYPSQRINERLLELTNADIAITHDDDWRFGVRHLLEDAEAVPYECSVEVDDACKQAWQRICSQHSSDSLLAKVALLWVLYSSRPITIEELRRAVATCPDTHKFDPSRLVSPTALLNLCCDLVHVERGSQFVRFTDSADKAMLQEALQDSFPYPHSLLAAVCTTHLTECGFQKTTINSEGELVVALQADPLLAYAYDTWATHIRQSLSHVESRRRTIRFIFGCRAFPCSGRDDPHGGFNIVSALHMLAVYHLPFHLIPQGEIGDPNTITSFQRASPLSLASRCGNEGLGEKLLLLPTLCVDLGDKNKGKVLPLVPQGSSGRTYHMPNYATSYANEKSKLVTISLEKGCDVRRKNLTLALVLLILLVLPFLLSPSRPLHDSGGVSVHLVESQSDLSNDPSQTNRRSSPFWGTPLPHERCSGYQTRRYTAELKDLPFLVDGIYPCEHTTITLNGRVFDHPEACERKWAFDVVTGQWTVLDQKECDGKWDQPVAKECIARGLRLFKARLTGVKNEADKEAICDATPISIAGTEFAHPDACEEDFYGLYGKWEVNDPEC